MSAQLELQWWLVLLTNQWLKSVTETVDLGWIPRQVKRKTIKFDVSNVPVWR